MKSDKYTRAVILWSIDQGSDTVQILNSVFLLCFYMYSIINFSNLMADSEVSQPCTQ